MMKGGTLLAIRDLSKSYPPAEGGARVRVLDEIGLELRAGECLAVSGPSGSGKSTLLKAIYGSCAIDGGSILVSTEQGATETTSLASRAMLMLRETHLSYVGQFLRVIPRISAVDIVARAHRLWQSQPGLAREEATALLDRLNLPAASRVQPPSRLSGGEQQRVNIARGLVRRNAILLLDEPTASLDAANRDVVVGLIDDAKAAGVGVISVFHDQHMIATVADRVLELRGRV
jgi:alpha-D-ribose 1-methylphosphonate 5-triphosphate synthase subunit PhnL